MWWFAATLRTGGDEGPNLHLLHSTMLESPYLQTELPSMFVAHIGPQPRRLPSGRIPRLHVNHGRAPGSLNVTLARKLGQLRPLLGGVAIGLLAGGVGTVPGDGLVVEIRRIPAQLGGQFSTQPLVVVATGHLLGALVDLGEAGPNSAC
jgi:hypothetical protein